MKCHLKGMGLLLGGMAALVLAGCGGKSQGWQVEVAADKPMHGLAVSYVTQQGLRRVALDSIKPGRYRACGQEGTPVVADIVAPWGGVLASVLLDNGERVTLTLKADTLAAFEAGGANRLLHEMLQEVDRSPEAADAEGRARLVERLVAPHPSSLASAALLALRYPVTQQSAERADSVVNTLLPEARPASVVAQLYQDIAALKPDRKKRLITLILEDADGGDLTFVASKSSYTALLFTGAETGRRSDAYGMLERLDTTLHRRITTAPELRRIAISVEGDSARWRHAVRPAKTGDEAGEAARWTHGRLPGGLGNPQVAALGITGLPALVVIDSLGFVTARL